MPPKKAAKKAAKKSAGHHDPRQAARDARRAFEHLGRVQALSSLTSEESESLSLLTTTANQAYRDKLYKQSADLLRAAEHLSFACLHAESTETVAKELKQVVKEEFDHLLEKLMEHTVHHDLPKSLLDLIARLTKDANSAMRRGSYRAALELARSAEALSHVDDIGQHLLSAQPAPKRLKA